MADWMNVSVAIDDVKLRRTIKRYLDDLLEEFGGYA